MGIKKFIKSVTSFLSINSYEVSGKKKSTKDLLKKLKKRRLANQKSLKIEEDKTKQKELQEEIDIISLQIRKGRKLLKNLEKK
jgi:hypothetical protein